MVAGAGGHRAVPAMRVERPQQGELRRESASVLTQCGSAQTWGSVADVMVRTSSSADDARLKDVERAAAIVKRSWDQAGGGDRYMLYYS